MIVISLVFKNISQEFYIFLTDTKYFCTYVSDVAILQYIYIIARLSSVRDHLALLRRCVACPIRTQSCFINVLNQCNPLAAFQWTINLGQL